MPAEFRTAELDNGLRIIAEVDDQAYTSACGFFVRTGTRDERKVDMGVSHFLEHMMFKGTDTRSAEDVNREFDELGANYNAFTSQEMTAFWAHVLPEYMPKAISLLGDIMRPSLRQEDFDTERGVILEEIAMYQDMPFWRLYDAAVARHYGEHPLSYRVLGTPESIQTMQREAMVRYFTQRYSADNTTLAVAGRIDFDAIVKDVLAFCGHWQRTNAARQYPQRTLNDSELTLEDPNTSRHYLLMLTPGPPFEDDERYAADMLAHLLGESEGSLLYWALVDKGIAEEAQVGYDGRDGLGEFFVFASCPPERAEEVESIINDQITRGMDLVTEDDLLRLRSKTATAATLAAERPAGRMRAMGRQWIYLHKYSTLEEELARIEAVTLTDVRNVYEKYGFKPRTIARLRPPTNATAASSTSCSNGK